MAKEETVPMAQLATRITRDLHKRLRLTCVRTDESMMEFVSRAIEERLERVATKAKAARAKA